MMVKTAARSGWRLPITLHHIVSHKSKTAFRGKFGNASPPWRHPTTYSNVFPSLIFIEDWLKETNSIKCKINIKVAVTNHYSVTNGVCTIIKSHSKPVMRLKLCYQDIYCNCLQLVSTHFCWLLGSAEQQFRIYKK